MKNLFSLIALFALPALLFSQNFSVGFAGGANLAFQHNEFQNENAGLKLGYTAEAQLMYHFSERFSLRTGFNFSRKGSKNLINFTDENGNPLNEGDAKFHLDYFQVPLLVQFSPTKAPAFFCNLGYSYGYLHQAVWKPTTIVNGEPYDEAQNYKRHDHAIIGGAGTKLPLSEKLTLTFEGRATFGVASVGTSKFFEIKNRSFDLLAGVVYQL